MYVFVLVNIFVKLVCLIMNKSKSNFFFEKKKIFKIKMEDKKKIYFSDRVDKVINELKLPEGANKELLKLRFVDEVEYYEKKRDHARKDFLIFLFYSHDR